MKKAIRIISTVGVLIAIIIVMGTLQAATDFEISIGRCLAQLAIGLIIGSASFGVDALITKED